MGEAHNFVTWGDIKKFLDGAEFCTVSAEYKKNCYLESSVLERNKNEKKLFCRCVYMSITAITALLVVCTCALAADIDLGEGYHVPQNFSSVLIESSDGTAIQNAVENIQPNGIIVLASGTFNLKEQINIKKNLTIRGQGSILKMDKSDRVFRCQGNITLESLDISGGSSTNGGGIKLDGGNVIIKDCKIHDNDGGLGGGGIYSMAKTLTLTSCDISNNTLAGLGGGIAFLGGTATITNCTITSNDTKPFGGWSYDYNE